MHENGKLAVVIYCVHYCWVQLAGIVGWEECEAPVYAIWALPYFYWICVFHV